MPFLTIVLSLAVQTNKLTLGQENLSQDIQPYVEISPKAARVFLKCLLLKQLPIQQSSHHSGSQQMSRAASLFPPHPIEEIRIDVGAPPKIPTHRGVDTMPGTYLVKLENGSTLYIVSKNLGEMTWFQRSNWYLRVLLVQFQAFFHEESLVRLDMEMAAAQRLFWVIHQGTRILY